MATFTSPMQEMQFNALNEMIAEYNSIVGKVNAAVGDKDALAESIANEKFADEVEQIRALQEALDAKVDAEVEKALNTEQGDTTELQEQAKEQKSTISSGLSYYKKLYGDEAAEQFTKLERLKGARVGGGSTGGRRIRGFRVAVKDSEGTVEHENFASAAKALGLGTAELQEIFFAKAGTEKLTDVPDVVEFTLNWEDEDEDGNKTPNSAEVKAFRETPLNVSDDAADDAEEDETDEVEVDEDTVAL